MRTQKTVQGLKPPGLKLKQPRLTSWIIPVFLLVYTVQSCSSIQHNVNTQETEAVAQIKQVFIQMPTVRMML